MQRTIQIATALPLRPRVCYPVLDYIPQTHIHDVTWSHRLPGLPLAAIAASFHAQPERLHAVTRAPHATPTPLRLQTQRQQANGAQPTLPCRVLLPCRQHSARRPGTGAARADSYFTSCQLVRLKHMRSGSQGHPLHAHGCRRFGRQVHCAARTNVSTVRGLQIQTNRRDESRRGGGEGGNESEGELRGASMTWSTLVGVGRTSGLAQASVQPIWAGRHVTLG